MSRLNRRLAGIVFFLTVIVFFVFYLQGIDYSKIRELSIDWALLTLATTVSLAFRFWGVFIWRSILKDFGSKELPKFSLLSAVYAKAWMGRYIPGSVTWIAGKIYLAGSIGISKSRLAVASLLEAAIQIVATAFTSSSILATFSPYLNLSLSER